jgi:hypothetical protein
MGDGKLRRYLDDKDLWEYLDLAEKRLQERNPKDALRTLQYIGVYPGIHRIEDAPRISDEQVELFSNRYADFYFCANAALMFQYETEASQLISEATIAAEVGSKDRFIRADGLLYHILVNLD